MVRSCRSYCLRLDFGDRVCQERDLIARPCLVAELIETILFDPDIDIRINRLALCDIERLVAPSVGVK